MSTITMTARHAQRPLRSGKSPYPELDRDGQLPSRPSSPDALSSNTPLLDTSTYPEIKPEQLAEQALDLAHSHQLAARQGRDRLLARLDDSKRVLHAVYHRLMLAAAELRAIPPAGLWFVENFSRIQELMRSARRDLRKGHRRELPHLCDDAGEGPPRVYDLARELIAHRDAQIDQESLHKFFSSYQTVAPLNLVELWSVCGMLRLGLIEFLCQVALRVAPPQSDRELNHSVIAHDARQEAADEVAMKHGILSLRDLAMLDWKEFVERESVVEHILREDPAGIHQRMSFASRDHYRRIVQRLARRSPLDEEQVARAAIEHARKAATAAAAALQAGGRATVQQHVGYYLVDRGRAALEAGIGYRPTWLMAWSWSDSLGGLRWPLTWEQSSLCGCSPCSPRQPWA